ncbi:hypothetical protein HWN40_05130 [Methanolobus zinderi]|uniref:Uncharacterized protein n=1 Tax=Methanolobus zinderi TaxID=536044 RepID=A0A7D5E8R6_9EURY|nr:hypothetical protein [Methanolobus zinderi]QLC49675.1 hypothetical protein HWN40_05130 [Methanolobus zinderi]
MSSDTDIVPECCHGEDLMLAESGETDVRSEDSEDISPEDDSELMEAAYNYSTDGPNNIEGSPEASVTEYQKNASPGTDQELSEGDADIQPAQTDGFDTHEENDASSFQDENMIDPDSDPDECYMAEGPRVEQVSSEDLPYSELEEKYLDLEARFAELQEKVNTSFNEQSENMQHIREELSSRSDRNEFKQLRKDFDLFSKRLRRVAKAEDSVNAEALDAAKVPPEVLEITYAKTLNDLYDAMFNIFGDKESAEIIEDARDKVRNFSAGVDFFRFENGTFRVEGLSKATSSKLVSVKQIHSTYIELFKLLSQHIPNYNSQDFRSFVETGSREYTVEKVVVHEESIESLWSEINNASEELSNLTENMTFIAELQNTQLDDIKSNSEGIEEINGKIQDIAKAVNLHTKALKKLNNNLASLMSSEGLEGIPSSGSVEVDISKFEQHLESKADRSEILDISASINEFREELKGSLVSMKEQQESMVSVEMLESIRSEVIQLREQMETLQNTTPAVPDVTDISDTPAVEEDPVDTGPQSNIGAYEQLIIEELASLGPVTLKQLENQVNSRGCEIGFDELSSIVDTMEQAQLLTSFKKGRYTYLSLKELANV